MKEKVSKVNRYYKESHFTGFSVYEKRANMLKLCENLSNIMDVSTDDAERIINSVMSAILYELANGNGVILPHIGKLNIKTVPDTFQRRCIANELEAKMLVKFLTLDITKSVLFMINNINTGEIKDTFVRAALASRAKVTSSSVKDDLMTKF